MDNDTIEKFTSALQDSKDDLALTIIENHDERTLRLLWHERKKPQHLVMQDDSLAKLLDEETWMIFSKRLHQGIRLHVFTSLGIIFIGILVLLWGILEVSSVLRYKLNYLAEINTFCLIPIGFIFILFGCLFLLPIRGFLRKVSPALKKKE
jgi:hypothetical protein